MHHLPAARASAGLIIGPAAWAVSTQGNYALVPWSCKNGLAVIPLLGLVLTLLSWGGALLSYKAWRTEHLSRASDTPEAGVPRAFLAALGTGLGLLFGVVVLFQATAGLIVGACIP